jgi:hypothetical protein
MSIESIEFCHVEKYNWNNFCKYFRRAMLKFGKVFDIQHFIERKEMVAAKRQIVK